MLKWPHAPAHLKRGAGAYIVTGATLDKVHFFSDRPRLELLTTTLLEVADEFGWALQAWAVFPNHYHFVAHSPAESGDLTRLVKKLHANTAREVNKLDHCIGRTVWYQYWDTPLTYEKSYFARLHYVHQNPVKHRLVKKAEDYEWCSAAWFHRYAPAALIELIESFPIDRLSIDDDY